MWAKKSLGQNFLNSKAIARDIVRAAELSPADAVLEIGPGKGFLTAELLSTGARVVAVEKDDRMIPFLEEKFANEIARKQLALIHEDVINLFGNGNSVQKSGEREEKGGEKIIPANSRYRENLRELCAGEKSPNRYYCYKVVANIPYYITGQILRMFLEAKEKPERMILMLQKEVAERTVARDKKESILSLSVKAYGDPRIIKKVPARYFTPAPKVDSAVLAIENISGKHFKDRASEERFFEIVKAGFAHKRKRLAGNLKEMFGNKTESLLLQAGIAPNARAEDVGFEQWLVLAEIYRG